MDERLITIEKGINAVENVVISKNLEVDNDRVIKGSITITEKNHSLNFDVTIYQPYPLQFHDVETIRFINPELIEFNHVNSDGSICIHTPHNEDLKSKIYYDISSLKEWMVKYYINQEVDEHYDHIMVVESDLKAYKSCYLFTDLNYDIIKGGFGHVHYSVMSKGMYMDRPVFTYLIQNFWLNNKLSASCKWSKSYSKLNYQKGLFVFLECPPVRNKRFIVDSWGDIEQYVTQEFLKFLNGVKKNNNFRKQGISELPLFIGYKIPTGETHWQCALIDVTAFPDYAEKNNGIYMGHLADEPINWAQTKNVSPLYFFGRGSLCDAITNKKILMIGIGAVGSIVATTLTRGGCKSITLVDHDIKEPENVCRSEYDFNSGLNGKVIDMKNTLTKISPFIEVSTFAEFMDAVKLFINNGRHNTALKKIIDQYDLIIDCTADNDVAYILESLGVESEIINLSITNHARELVCAVKPNLYHWLQQIFKYLSSENDDLYNPTGCWSPTFRASYNDINFMVQFAIKHINLILKEGKPLRSFYLKSDDTNDLNIKLHQF